VLPLRSSVLNELDLPNASMPPSTIRNVGVIVGSLRKESFTRKIANAIAKLAPASLNLEIIEIGQLSSYDPDLENTPPADWVAFRQKVTAVDAVLFATPEYNRSVPGLSLIHISEPTRPY